MKPAAFTYHAPQTIREAVALLTELAPHDCRVISGGQSLMPMMAFRVARPRHLIDINGVHGLDRLEVSDGQLIIGACVRHAAFENHVEDGSLGQILAAISKHIAHTPIRARGTFCGSLANADPASEWCLTVATLGATLTAEGGAGERKITADQFFVDIMTTALEPSDLLVRVAIPLLPQGTRFGFYEFNRRAGDFALAMALVTYELQGGAIAVPRIGIGGVERTPRRLKKAEDAVLAQVPTPALHRSIAEMAAAEVEPLEDPRVSAEYRRELTRTVVQRALEMAAR